MNLRSTFLLSILVSVNFNSFAALDDSSLKGASPKEEKLNLFEMKKKLNDQARFILDLNKEMSQVETHLGMQNKKYLKLSESRIKIEEQLNQIKKNVDLDNLNLKKNYNETKNVLMGILLNKLEKSENSSDLLARKILVRDLQKKLVDLDALMKTNQEANAGLEDLYERLNASLKTEKELVAVMNELEAKKRELREQIETETNKKIQDENKFTELKNRTAVENDSLKRQRKKEIMAPTQITEEIKIPSVAEVNAPLAAINGYRAPLISNSGIEYNQKGVTFKFQGKNEVLATKAGRIAYTGSLANYGNVVMIDHGNDTRTVLLGQFDFSVKNGDKVSDSQIIGYTNPKSVNGLGDGKLYFEVRKNNLAQNTYMLIDKKTLKSSH